MRFVFMLAEKAFPIRWMCKHLEVSCSGFYAWRSRPESEYARRNRVLGVRIAAVHSENRGVYGSPRIYDELRADGEAVSKKRVAPKDLPKSPEVPPKASAVLPKSQRVLPNFRGVLPNSRDLPPKS